MNVELGHFEAPGNREPIEMKGGLQNVLMWNNITLSTYNKTN